jgi:hypothetical protein
LGYITVSAARPNDPWGNRTPTYRLRTCRPEPLDERAVSRQCLGWESNPHCPQRAAALQAAWRPTARPKALSIQWHRWDSNPQSPGFEPGREADLRTVPRHRSKAPGGSRTHTTAIPRLQAATTSQGRTPRERPVGVEPTRPPWQGDRLPLHHGRGRSCDSPGSAKPEQARLPEHPAGIAPATPPWEGGMLLLHHGRKFRGQKTEVRGQNRTRFPDC